MIPIEFWVTRSKVKVIGALNGCMFLTYYLGYYLSQSLNVSLIGHNQKMTPIDFGVTMSKVKVTGVISN
jgi:hypothetical protein